MAKILGVKIHNYKFREVMQKITEFLSENKLHQIVTVNPEFVLAAQKDSEFQKVLNHADLSIPDGFGLQIAARMTGQIIGERLTGVDLTWEIAKLAAEKEYSIYFLGAKNGVAEMTAKKIKIRYPKLKIAGTSASDPDDKSTLENIKKAKPDILLVAYGAPKQDKFIYNLKNNPSFRISHFLKLAVGVGGTFDYIAEVVPRAPSWMRKIGLEWLYRLVRQPKRIGRIFRAVVVFPLTVLFFQK